MRLIRPMPIAALGVICLSTAGTLNYLKGQSWAEQKTSKIPAHVLVISETKGFEHDSIPDAMGTIWRMGHDTKLWDATLRTDTELITKQHIKDRNRKDLNYFDALIFASTTGELDLTDDQKTDMMSFIKEDGKGFVGVHAALDTNYKWPEY